MSHAPNRLIRSSSPYLLQHAHNPVDWYPWSEEAFERAVREDKLVLISIGYSACHWCHVMERESFEDPEVATVMNDHFVCIKVDREERPDVDQVYMSAVQLLTGSGGWPLNCFALPDGRPVYGGTYFPKNRWIEVLVNLSEMYRNNKVRLEGYAAQLAAGVQEEDRLPVMPQPSAANAEILDAAVQKWKAGLDQTEGGPNRAPKFPLPSNYRYLLVRAIRHRDSLLLDHVRLTLQKMAFGGIYDQIGGGFCRYSVDAVWKVPHFEKMLYDNAQLISLYAEAYKYFKEPLYQQIATSTIDFVLRELCGPQHHFFSALDADSEGEEGKFYVWQPAEVEQILGMDAPLFMDYFSMNEAGYWEHGNYILLRKEETTVVASRHGMSAEQAESIIQNCRVKLMDSRSRRIRPGLDDKTLTSWNAMMITALLDAYDAFGEQRFLDAATRNAAFISNQLIREDGGLWHSWKVTPSVNGYLEDYAFVAQAFIRMYQCTFQRSWIDQARDLCMYALDHFASEGSPLLHFTSDLDPPLFARKQELQDQVIPSSNSQMAWNLYLLGRYYDREGWMSRARQMWNAIAPRVKFYPSAWSNWMLLAEILDQPPEEVVICGEQALQERSEWASAYHLFTLIGGCVKSDGMPWTLHRVPDQGTQVFRCVNHTCSLPVASIAALPEGL